MRVAWLGLFALLGLGACKRASQEAPPARQSTRAVKLEVVRVDDSIDPCAKLADSPPEGIDSRVEIAPLERDKAARHSFLHTKLAKGETLAAATSRLRKVTDTLSLPPGDRFAFEATVRFDAESGGSTADGVRSYVLTGTPIVTEGDIAEAKAEVATVNHNKEHTVRVVLRPDAAARFANETGQWAGRRIAIVVDDVVTSVPVIKEAVKVGGFNINMGPGDDADQSAEALKMAKGLSGK